MNFFFDDLFRKHLSCFTKHNFESQLKHEIMGTSWIFLL
jgi:hypothetical protein